MRLRLHRLTIPFTAAFRHGSAVRTATQAVWVEARARDGVVGVGEGCPREYVTGEDLESAAAFVRHHAEAVCRDVGSVETLAAWVAEHAAVIDEHPAAWCAIELAVLELLARRAGVPVEQVLDAPAPTGTFHYSAVVGDSAPDRFRAAVGRYREQGFTDFKLKLSGDATRDRDKIVALREAGDREALRIRVDANNLWEDAETAARYVTGLDTSFVGIEEPLPANAVDQMRLVSERTGSPIILDESLLRVGQLAALAVDPNRWVVNVRVSKMGGILRSLRVVSRARELGVPVIVGAQVGETSVLTRAALVVARAAGRDLLAQEGAFGTHLLCEDVAEPPLMFGRAGILDADAHGLSTQAGWGLTLRGPIELATLLSE